jgi:hypothetical protein
MLSDGVISSGPGEGASGSIAHDHKSQLFAAKAIWYPKAANALSMEAHAIRDGVILARDRKVIMETASLVLSKLLNIMETDSMLLSKLLTNGNFKRSEIAYILYGVMEFSQDVSRFSVVFIRNAGNDAVHLCAQYFVKERQRCIWTEYAPGLSVIAFPLMVTMLLCNEKLLNRVFFLYIYTI